MSCYADINIKEQPELQEPIERTKIIPSDMHYHVVKERAADAQAPAKPRRQHRRGRRSLVKLSLHKKRKKTVSEEK